VREQLETFLARAHERERPVPRFVERELRRYLECGILAHGFLRVRCEACGLEQLVAFSCKGRGFCALSKIRNFVAYRFIDASASPAASTSSNQVIASALHPPGGR
jgi:hypothetical protein